MTNRFHSILTKRPNPSPYKNAKVNKPTNLNRYIIYTVRGQAKADSKQHFSGSGTTDCWHPEIFIKNAIAQQLIVLP